MVVELEEAERAWREKRAEMENLWMIFLGGLKFFFWTLEIVDIIRMYNGFAFFWVHSGEYEYLL